MTEQDHQHRPPKREFERHSGTGRPIKGENKRQGGGAANWGSTQEAVQQGVEQFNTGANPEESQNAANKPKPQNQAELNEIEKKEEQKTSYDDFVKETDKPVAYNTKTVESQFKKAMRLNKSERETDKLFAGDQKDKKKRNKKKKTKKLLATSFTYDQSQNDRGRGRGRGGGRGRGFDNQNFGQNNFNPRAGFGSRGRGRRNENFDNNNVNTDDNQPNNNNQNNNKAFSQSTAPAKLYRKKESSQTTTTTDNTTNQPAQTTEQANQSSNQ